MSRSALIYVAPVPSTSFRQRPQAFVEYFLALGVERVVWIEPYPTRLFRLHDLHRIRRANGSSHPRQDVVRIKVHALPIEPLPWLRAVNNVAFRHAMGRLEGLLKGYTNTVLAIGKPSLFARNLLRQRRWTRTLYDAMDNFPYFYTGLDRRNMARVESEIIADVDALTASSQAIASRIPGAEIVPNAYDPSSVLTVKQGPQTGRPIIGYVGTLGQWFDWRLVLRIAGQFPDFDLRLIGPVAAKLPEHLPSNVHILGEKPHAEAMQEAARFTVGLIPFLINELTNGVDPVKYYEYRALGLPVVATPFGELAGRQDDSSLFFIADDTQLDKVVKSAVAARKQANPVSGIDANTWHSRFTGSRNIQSLVDVLDVKMSPVRRI